MLKYNKYYPPITNDHNEEEKKTRKQYKHCLNSVVFVRIGCYEKKIQIKEIRKKKQQKLSAKRDSLILLLITETK